MIELPTLYPHQEDQRDRTRTALAQHGRVILNAPTGCGKTRMSKWILGACANRAPGENQSGNYLFTVHRRGLVDNACQSFAEAPKLAHGVIMSDVKPELGHRIQVASIDTLLSWFVEDGTYTNRDLTFDLIVWDEAHSHHPKMARFLEAHDRTRSELGLSDAYLIGLTATPQAQGLADVYREIVQGPATQWLIDNGYLSPFRYFQATQGNLDKLKRHGNEFTKKSESEAMEGLAGDLVRDWRNLAEGRPTVGFFPRRSHAQDAMRQLADAGVRVGYVDGNTADAVRHQTYYDLQNGGLDYICNVQVIERGTDLPAIGCVQLCVAIGNVVRYRQMIGRGSRTCEGKTDCIVLDHGGNVARHGLFEDDPPWSLDITTRAPGESGARPTIECPKCNAIYRGGRCNSCGYEPTARERRAKGLEFDGQELKEYTRPEVPVSVKSAEELMITALYMAGRSGRTWRQACGIFKGLQKKQGTNYRVPKSIMVGGSRYECIRYGDPNGDRRVSRLYPWTSSRGNHGGEYLAQEVKPVGAAW